MVGAQEIADWTWIIVQDCDALHGASKDRVREILTEWREGRSVERDGPGADDIAARLLARFTYAVHIGKDSLDSLRLFEESSHLRRKPEVVMAIVEAPIEIELPPTYAEQDEEDEEYDDEEADLEPYDIGWTYGVVEFYGSTYGEMSDQQFWQHYYVKPPRIKGSLKLHGAVPDHSDE